MQRKTAIEEVKFDIKTLKPKIKSKKKPKKIKLEKKF